MMIEISILPAFFDYRDRYYKMEKNESSDSTNEINTFVKNMWEDYRGVAAVIRPPDSTVLPAQPTGVKVKE